MAETPYSRDLCDERHKEQDKKIDLLFAKHSALEAKIDRINSLLVVNLFSMVSGFLVGIGMYMVRP